jgi:hypothetical protein
MESLSQNNVGPPTPRPALSLSANVAAALHEGRVVAGEVIQRLGGGSVLVAIGNLRVPARAQVALQPGQRFMATVETTGEVVVLRVHSGEKASGISPLLDALRALLPSERPIGAVLSELIGLLKAPGGRERGGEPGGLLKQLTEHVFQPGSKGGELASLLQRSGLGLEAALLKAALGRGVTGSAALGIDLKARLLMARAASPDAALKEALTKAIRSIQSEQVMGLAREAGSEPRCISLPFPDPGLEGGAWTTAWLTFRDDREDERSLNQEEGGVHLQVDLELTKLGQVRADLCLSARGVKVRVLVATERAQEVLKAALPSLEAGLSASGLEVDVRVGITPPEAIGSPEDAASVRFLREHHLLDESA